MQRELKGRHVFAIIASGFAVIITVNLTLAFQAVSTFPGLETDNSYVVSQRFEGDRSAQDALGWAVDLDYAGRTLTLSVRDAEGEPVQPELVSAVLGRATHVADDRTPDFRWNGRDHVAWLNLQPGNWNLRLEAEAADGTAFRRRLVLAILDGA